MKLQAAFLSFISWLLLLWKKKSTFLLLWNKMWMMDIPHLLISCGVKPKTITISCWQMDSLPSPFLVFWFIFRADISNNLCIFKKEKKISLNRSFIESKFRQIEVLSNQSFVESKFCWTENLLIWSFVQSKILQFRLSRKKIFWTQYEIF